MDNHASTDAVEGANRPLGELRRTTKRATENKVGGILDKDHPLTSLDGATLFLFHCSAGSSCDLTVGRLTKCCETTATEAVKSLGHEFQERSCCVTSSK